MTADENTPSYTPEQLAQRAMLAYRVKAYVDALCDPVIKANSDFIRDTPGIRSTDAQFDGVRAVTFTGRTQQPFFFVEDEDAWKLWADEKGETDYLVKPSFTEAILKKRATWDAQNKVVVDKTTGEIVPGVSYDPGGKFRGVNPTWTDAGMEGVDKILQTVLGRAVAALPELSPAESGDAK
ncbi:hypothetical protein ACFYZ9_33515 [Streptomyces sp. NPDC001691]|uniref:hypothetical protein n=1 Tax=Streptomyces sp. NPDC001691 TaxID=3364600 RepID=UPI0036AD08E4